MKFQIKLVLVVFIIFFFAAADAKEKQKPQWKGKIEYENGIKIIKNPKEPLYGEIKFELEEDLSIGREDDENYLFYRAMDIVQDSEENIYIADSRNFRVQKFDNKGQYLLSTLLTTALLNLS